MIALGQRVLAIGVPTPEETGDAMTFYDFLQFGVCMFSILAAGFWLQSATSRLAIPITKASRQGAGMFPQALTSQSRWTAAGAVCAGTAALSQSVAAVLPYVGLK
jgi:hypothetical protein